MSLVNLHLYNLQVPILNLYYLLAEVNIGIKDAAYAISCLVTGLSTIRYSHIAVYKGHTRSR